MSSLLSSLSSQLAHLRNALPMATLVTELVSHQEGQFAVRAAILVGNQPLVTGMAAHPNIEVAEDRARERVLQLFADWLPQAHGQGMTSTPVSSPTTPPASSFTPLASTTQPTAKPPGLDADFPTSSFSSSAPFIGGTAPSAAPSTDTASGAIADLYSHINLSEPPSNGSPHEEPPFEDGPPLEDNPPYKDNPPFEDDPPFEESPPPDTSSKTAPTPKKSASSRGPVKKGSRKSAEPPPATVQESVDLSDVIAHTDIELRRLNWTNVQGREYLEKTYGKRSRQELSELELYEFLSYLEELPTPES